MTRELFRLLAYARPHAGTLSVAVVLMAIAGAAQAAVALLLQPVFDRVLAPDSTQHSAPVLRIPGGEIQLTILNHPWFSDIWTAVAAAIVAVFLIKDSATTSATTSPTEPDTPPLPTSASTSSSASSARTQNSTNSTRPAC